MLSQLLCCEEPSHCCLFKRPSLGLVTSGQSEFIESISTGGQRTGFRSSADEIQGHTLALKWGEVCDLLGPLDKLPFPNAHLKKQAHG